MRCSLNSTLPTALARFHVSEHGLGGFECTRDISPVKETLIKFSLSTGSIDKVVPA
jgi:hypothetical protein